MEPTGKDLCSESLRTDILYWANAFGIEVIDNIYDNPELIGGD